MTYTVSIASINTRKSRSATLDAASTQGWKLLCLQEPYTTREGKLQVLGAFSATTNEKIRAAIICKLPGAKLLPSLSNGDVCTVTFGEGRIWVSSVYCDGKREAIPPLVETLVDTARRKGILLILQADTNSHSPLWGSPESNRRGDEWEDFIFERDLEVANMGNVYTFENEQGQKSHIDVTLSNRASVVTRWRVDDGPMISDHRKIEFDILVGEGGGREGEIAGENALNVRKANWDLFREKLAELNGSAEMRLPDGDVGTQLEERATRLKEMIHIALREACPRKKKLDRKPVPWWTPDLSKERKDVNRKYRKWKKYGSNEDETTYKHSLQMYKEHILESKENSWRNFCSEVNNGDEMAALARAVKRNGSNQQTLVDGASDTKEHAKTLLQSHFPGMVLLDEEPEEDVHRCDETCRAENPKNRRLLASITAERVKKVFASFGPHKAAGSDEIKPIVLQALDEATIEEVVELYHQAIKHGITPVEWRRMKVVFIPKAGKDPRTPKGYRPITLSSFILKGLEKAVLWHLQECKMVTMTANQHAYTVGKSCDTALMEAVAQMEKGREKGKLAMVVALDASGAFDRLNFEAATEAMKAFKWPPQLTRWYSKLLGTRHITSEGIAGRPTRGTPQGGILSPTLWNMAVNRLLRQKGARGTSITGYADDLLIISTGKEEAQTARNLQLMLAKAQDWGEDAGIDFNPAKTEMMILTRRKKVSPANVILGGKPLPVQKEIKYLGVTIDDKLSYKSHIKQKIAKAIRLLHHCKSMIGTGWGLNNDRLWWAYDSLIRSLLSHGACIHSMASTQTKDVKRRLSSLQRKILILMTRAMRGTPTAGMEVALGIPPLHLWLRKRGLETRMRIHQVLTRETQRMNGKTIRLATDGELDANMPLDFTKEISTAAEKEVQKDSGRKFTAYTDGSRMNDRTGYAWLFTRGLQVLSEGGGFLGSTGTVFQAEIAAISSLLEWLLEPERSLKLREGDSITIRSDSQSGIAALNSRTLNSKMVKDCQEKLNECRKRYRMSLEWVRGHADDTGNEAADAAAKSASEAHWEGAFPWGPVPFSWIKGKLGAVMEKEWTREWDNRKDCRQSKAMLGKPTRRTWQEMKTEPREKLRRWIGFTTGHTHMRRHLAIVLEKESADIFCRLCNEGQETPLHMMICPALEYERFKYVAIRNYFSVKESLFTYIDDVWRRIRQTHLNDTPTDLI
jgi:ribonuclease HI